MPRTRWATSSDCPGHFPRTGWATSSEYAYARGYAERIDLAAMEPAPERCSSRYCLVGGENTRPEFLVYSPEGGSVSVDLRESSGTSAVEWFSPETGNHVPGDMLEGEGVRSLQPPFPGDAVLYLSPISGDSRNP